MFLEVEAVSHHNHHQHKVEEIDGEQIFPLERKELVDTQTGNVHLNHMMINDSAIALPINHTTEGYNPSHD